MPTEPPAGVPWLVWLILFMAFGPPALVSKTAAKFPSVLGATARWYQARQPKKNEIVTAANLHEVVEQLVDKKVNKIRKEVELLADYLAYDASWHRRADIHAGEAGFEFPPPPHLTLDDWLKDRDREYPKI